MTVGLGLTNGKVGLGRGEVVDEDVFVTSLGVDEESVAEDEVELVSEDVELDVGLGVVLDEVLELWSPGVGLVGDSVLELSELSVGGEVVVVVTSGGTTASGVESSIVASSSACRLTISSKASSNHEACTKEASTKNAIKVVCGLESMAS